MKEFTIKNLFLYWLKLWPITALLLVAGVAFGCYSAFSSAQQYESQQIVLIYNKVSDEASEYTTIISSDALSEIASDCVLESTQQGKATVIKAACDDPTKSKKVVDDVTDGLISELKDFYGDDAIKAKILTQSEDGKATVTTKQRLAKMMVPCVAAVAVSVAIAFIGLDFKVSKNEK